MVNHMKRKSKLLKQILAVDRQKGSLMDDSKLSQSSVLNENENQFLAIAAEISTYEDVQETYNIIRKRYADASHVAGAF